VKHLGIAQEVLSKALGPITLVGQPMTLSRTPSKLAMAAPEYGEHNDAVLTELGYSPAEIEAFRKAGAI
jgi:crotonobetainyl-CoA:carnitine CoA-transferase CaiB-like acyl-CoA transferase